MWNQSYKDNKKTYLKKGIQELLKMEMSRSKQSRSLVVIMQLSSSPNRRRPLGRPTGLSSTLPNCLLLLIPDPTDKGFAVCLAFLLLVETLQREAINLIFLTRGWALYWSAERRVSFPRERTISLQRLINFLQFMYIGQTPLLSLTTHWFSYHASEALTSFSMVKIYVFPHNWSSK